ncbi:heavy metal-associated isoprenylated plant protein 39 isoform X1 [Zea mays]|uniref:Heavy metal transport/detoxification superfamily protein n=1 Tax=Zea mays TaxID=4577 RepID=A0A1D6K7D5_MAIZE|nr:heavy metal-associated isoprenylated plant protein 39 isoform X1 [Zea mays]ONL99468.1 Heavy metal transport/detoxification superfamily protein [Zea mays]|eukprot:XP_008657844.1 heavy metal-associated isoprenylated plant protein 39 isoform X1 [Zea mays]
MSKKIVVKLHLQDNKDKQKAMKAVSALTGPTVSPAGCTWCAGIDEISADMASHKMTVVGMVDPVSVVSKLRKASWSATIESVGPAKEPEKKDGEAAKKDGGEGEKKEGGEGEKKEAGEGENKKEAGGEKDKDGKKAAPPTEQQVQLAELLNQYYRASSYYPYPPVATHYHVQSMEEDPNSCTVC